MMKNGSDGGGRAHARHVDASDHTCYVTLTHTLLRRVQYPVAEIEGIPKIAILRALRQGSSPC